MISVVGTNVYLELRPFIGRRAKMLGACSRKTSSVRASALKFDVVGFIYYSFSAALPG
jgi:hypothetical protein